MKQAYWFVAILGLCTSPPGIPAEQATFSAMGKDARQIHVSPMGKDAPDCGGSRNSCKTIKYACGLIREGTTSLNLAPGTYDPDRCAIAHFRFVQVIGHCADPTKVVVRAPGGLIFSAEDHATMTINCLSIGTSAGGSGVVGFHTRQFAIGDYIKVHFSSMAVAVSASEHSKINCLGGIRISGTIHYYIAASGTSTVKADCDTTLVGSPAINSLYWAVKESRVEAEGGSFSGAAIVKYKYIVDHSTLYKPTKAIPGSETLVQNGGTVF